MKYVSNLYLSDGKPHVSLTAVDTEIGPPPSAGAPASTLIRPISKDSGWVLFSGDLHETEGAARIEAISKIDVLVAHLENLRATLVKKHFANHE